MGWWNMGRSARCCFRHLRPRDACIYPFASLISSRSFHIWHFLIWNGGRSYGGRRSERWNMGRWNEHGTVELIGDGEMWDVGIWASEIRDDGIWDGDIYGEAEDGIVEYATVG